MAQEQSIKARRAHLSLKRFSTILKFVEIGFVSTPAHGTFGSMQIKGLFQIFDIQYSFEIIYF